jgi:hypothetical protein
MALRWSRRRSAFALPLSLPLLASLALLDAGVAGPLEAQRVREFGVQVTGIAAEQPAVLAGPVVALRPASRVRVSIGAGAGASEGEAAWRAELLGHFLLSPAERRGVGLYGAAGVAAVGGPVEQGYLVLALGAEARPGGRSGWMVEAGLGGGARLVAGYRIRRFRAGRGLGE